MYEELIEQTRLEKGCLSYELLKDIEDTNSFVMLEEWGNRELLEAHFQSEHFKRLVPQIGKLTSKNTEVTILKKQF